MSQDLDLKNIRQSKGLTLDDIARRTMIRSGFLEAIEEENYHLLPEKYYAEHFIKVYADTLGIDSAPFLARYRQFLEKTGQTIRKEPQHEIKGEPKKHFTWPSLTKRHYRLIGWAISLAVIMTIIVFILYPRETVVEVPAPPLSTAKPPDVSGQETPATEAPMKGEEVEKPGPSQEKTEVKEQTEPKKETPPTGSAEESKKKYTLRIEATELTWLRIKEDKQTPRQYLLQPGEKLSRQATDRFEIEIGNAGGVHLNFQGKSLGAAGKSGEVVRLVLPEERTF